MLPLPFHDSSVGKESTWNAGDPGLIPGLGRSSGEGRLPTPVFLGFPCGSAGKESACNVGDLGSIPGLGRPPGEGKGYPLQYSGLEKSMDCIVHGVAKSQSRLSDFHFHYRYVHSIPHHNNVTSGITYVKAITMFSTLQSSTTLGSSKKIFYWKLKVVNYPRWRNCKEEPKLNSRWNFTLQRKNFRSS